MINFGMTRNPLISFTISCVTLLLLTQLCSAKIQNRQDNRIHKNANSINRDSSDPEDRAAAISNEEGQDAEIAIGTNDGENDEDNDPEPSHIGHQTAASAGCDDLSGFWYNQHGSELYISAVGGNGKFKGEYRTGVQQDDSSTEAQLASEVSGKVTRNLVTFSVMWGNRGDSVTAWTGQCHVACNHGHAKAAKSSVVLYTTWIITNRHASCTDHWNSNKVGQDVFFRKPVKDGPRKHGHHRVE